MKLPSETKLFLGIFIATLAIIGITVFFFSQPSAPIPREKLLPSDTYTKGTKEATVYLVEFSDFQCPACVSFKPMIDEIINQYQSKLVFGYRHFPLSQHQFAMKAALAAEAAGEQGKFWEMYDYLFSNSTSLSDKTISDGATKIGLDTAKFQNVLADNKFKEKIERDLNDGKSFGVNATPTFFLNGKKLSLFNQEDLKKKIQQELAKSS